MMLHVMIPNSFALRVSRCFLYFLCLFPLYSLRKIILETSPSTLSWTSLL